MEDLQAAREAMELKTQRKRELINQLKTFNTTLQEIRDELNKLQPSAPARRTPSQRLLEKAEHMEFVISTSAYTPAQERAMIKELKLVRDQIGVVAVQEKASEQVQGLRTKLREQLDARAPVQKELDVLRSELEVLYQTILKAGAERAKMHAQREESGNREERRPREGRPRERRPAGAGQDDRRSFQDERRKLRDEERAEMAPYMKEVDPYVSMEEIAVFKKKPVKVTEE